MAATIAAHWYQQELGSPSNEGAHSRFPFLRMPHRRRRTSTVGNSTRPSSATRPTTAKSSRSFHDRPPTSKSNVSPSKNFRRQSISAHSVAGAQSTRTIVVMKSPAKISRVQQWRKKFQIPSLAYYGWGSVEDVKAEAARSKPVTSIPPNVRTATTDDLIDEAQADDMILLTEMRAPSAMAAHQSMGGLTLVESRLSSNTDELDLSWVRIEDERH